MKSKSYVAFLERDKETGKYGVVVPDIPGFSTIEKYKVTQKQWVLTNKVVSRD